MAKEEFIGKKDTTKCMVSSKDCTLYVAKQDEYGKYDDPQPIKLKGALFMDMDKKGLEELEKAQYKPKGIEKVSVDTIKNEQFYGTNKLDNLQTCLDRILHFSTIEGGANQVRESYKRLGEILENEKGILLESNVLYLCDHKKCEKCHDYCKHTQSIKHAINFENKNGTYYEQDNLQMYLNVIDNLNDYIERLKEKIKGEQYDTTK